MKLFFSEAEADYARYLFPYVVWGVPEADETPAHCLERGFAPSSPQLDRFVLCRQVRVDLRRYEPSSENRRILRKGEGIEVALIDRAHYDYTPERRAAWKSYTDRRFGEDAMSEERMDRLMQAPVINHLLVYRDSATDRELGTVLLFLQAPRVAYYYYAFYDLDQRERNLGMFMMTRAAGLLAERGFEHLYLGTCYSPHALYKTQFQGTEFFNGNGWSANLDELKYLVHLERTADSTHLLEDASYLERFLRGAAFSPADASPWHLR